MFARHAKRLLLPAAAGLAVSTQIYKPASGDTRFNSFTILDPELSNEKKNINKGCSVENMFLDQESITGVDKEAKKSPELLPTIPLSEVQADHGEEVWVTWKGGVFNVTPFLDAHPGGASRIQMVNGQDLKAFWTVYAIHNRPHIQALLQDYRIGNLTPEDQKTIEAQSAFGNYYLDQPKRAESELRVASHHPWNSEPDLDVLIEDFFTPNHLFFVRNHNSVPMLELEDWVLEVAENKDIGLKGHTFTYDDLKTMFKKHEVISTLQCAGNRQEDFVTPDRPLYVAPHWRNGAIGCAKWGGVKVRDILAHCGLDVDAIALGNLCVPQAKICNFIGADEDETGVPYGGVLPMEKVIDPFGDVILAYEMNGETLPRDHGFPVRCLAPGHAGCRNVKWVTDIIVSEQASEFDSGSKLDRHFAPDVAFKQNIIPEVLNWEQGPVIQTLPVQSIICSPKMGQILPGNSDFIQIRGVAWSGAGRGICRVEVSIDGGANFTACHLLERPTKEIDPQCGMGRNWAWHQWVQNVPIPEDLQERIKNNETVDLEIVVRAIDGDFNGQPQSMEEVWNVLGICVNHWNRVKVSLNPLLSEGEPYPKALSTPPPGQWVWKHDYERVDLNPNDEY